MHAHTEQSSCSVLAVGVWGMLMSVQSSSLCLQAHWPQCLSGRLKRRWTVQKLLGFFSILLFFLSPFISCTRQLALSLSAMHIHLLIWSSVGQRGSSERQECWQAGWLMKNRGEKSCTGLQVLFKMCYWPLNGRDSQHVKSTHCQNMN